MKTATITKYFIFILALIAVVIMLWLIRDTLFAKNHGATAVVDLDKVAMAIGRSEVISNKVSTFISKEEKNINNLKQKLVSKIKTTKQAMGDTPSQEQKQQLALLTQKSNIKLQQTVEQMQNATDTLKLKLVRQFRDEVEPIIRQIADEKKFDLVEIKSPKYIYINSDVNISDAVIDKLLTLKPVKKTGGTSPAKEKKSTKAQETTKSNE